MVDLKIKDDTHGTRGNDCFTRILLMVRIRRRQMRTRRMTHSLRRVRERKKKKKKAKRSILSRPKSKREKKGWTKKGKKLICA